MIQQPLAQRHIIRVTNRTVKRRQPVGGIRHRNVAVVHIGPCFEQHIGNCQHVSLAFWGRVEVF